MTAAQRQALQVLTPDGYFNPPFFELLHIKPYKFKHMDLESPSMKDLIKDLIEKGYDGDKPVILAMCNDPEVNDQVMDGRRRLYASYKAWVKTGIVPDIVIIRKQVKDLAELKARMFIYEREHLLRKSDKVAREHMADLTNDLLTLKPELRQQKFLDAYIDTLPKDLGYKAKYVEQAIKKELSKKSAPSKTIEVEDWEIKDGDEMKDADERKPAKKEGKTEGQTASEIGCVTSYRDCPVCHSNLAVLADEKEAKVKDIRIITPTVKVEYDATKKVVVSATPLGQIQVNAP